ncbi:hypothetical protein D3C80_1732820 [compost metagenome]
MQANGNKGDIAGDIKQVTPRVEAERDGTKGNCASQIDQVAKNGVRGCFFKHGVRFPAHIKVRQ